MKLKKQWNNETGHLYKSISLKWVESWKQKGNNCAYCCCSLKTEKYTLAARELITKCKFDAFSFWIPLLPEGHRESSHTMWKLAAFGLVYSHGTEPGVVIANEQLGQLSWALFCGSPEYPWPHQLNGRGGEESQQVISASYPPWVLKPASPAYLVEGKGHPLYGCSVGGWVAPEGQAGGGGRDFGPLLWTLPMSCALKLTEGWSSVYNKGMQKVAQKLQMEKLHNSLVSW